MTISGFTMVRNATRFYFPIRESIESILPLVDEFVVALGKGSDDDRTLAEIEALNSPKIKIIHREWDEQKFKNSVIFRDETDVAMSACSGDWCFYLQADEVVHEEDLEAIREACNREVNNTDVDGLLFSYHHFWGDYNHFLPFHGWYRKEIRIIRNRVGISSWKDAQSFRRSGEKIRVKKINAHIYHYGWVRPPGLMRNKKKEHDSIHWGKEKAEKQYQKVDEVFDYGPLGRIPVFKGTHPRVMHQRIAQLNWEGLLNYGNDYSDKRDLLKHEKAKYRMISWFENRILGGKQLFGYSNWKRI